MSRKKQGEAWNENGFEEWGGYMAAKKAKLEEQFVNQADKEYQDASGLFKGIAIFVNGYTTPTADELRRLMMEHGGIYHHYMRPKITTHIIASNLPYSKIVMYRKSQNPIPLCKPEWIMDSIKAGRVLNFQDYLLYTNCSDKQPKLAYTKKQQESTSDFPEKTIVDSIDAASSNRVNDCPSGISSNNFSPTSTKSNAMCSKDSGFLSEFYSHSRLHHISTMGATFKNYVNELRDKSDGKFPGLAKLVQLKKLTEARSELDEELDEVVDSDDENRGSSGPNGTVIMHIDMDCFFVSVGLRDRADLKGLPVAVTHAKGLKGTSSKEPKAEDKLGSLSEVASCSYEARKAGVKNGMFLGEALKICPNLKTIPYNFDGYTEVSYTLYDTVASYTFNIEAVSCDEMYADCTQILQQSGLSPLEFATIIRKEIKEKTGCPVSTGFGSNKLLARLATRKAKPDGQFFIRKEQAEGFLADFNVRDLPGVGGTTAQKLHGLNVRTCADLRSLQLAVLQKEFGKKTGEMLHNMPRGIDHSKLNLEHIRKSVSAEVNYGIRFESNEDAIDFLKKLAEEVCNRLKQANAKGRSVTLKVLVRAKEAPKDPAKFMGHGLCDYITRSKNLISPINDVAIITKEVLALWSQLQQVPEDTRGIGIQITRLEITKNKPRHGSLVNFMNKPRQGPTIKEVNDSLGGPFAQCPQLAEIAEKPKPNDLRTFFTDNQEVKSNTAASECSVKNTAKEKPRLPPDINKSVFGELPKDIQDEILDLAESGNNIQGVLGAQIPSDTGKKQCQEEGQLAGPSTSTRGVSPSGNSAVFDPDDGLRALTSSRRQTENKLKDTLVRAEPTSTKTLANTSEHTAAGKTTQTLQEHFFKHTKPNAVSSTKIDMPPIQDIDMTVLIELPADIRNEILNEYSANKRCAQSVLNETNNLTSKQPSNVQGRTTEEDNTGDDHHDVSFSQVDPEFLAALSEDLRRDVQLYCADKKAQKHSIPDRVNTEEARVIAKPSKAPSIPKQKRQPEKSAKPKNNAKGSKGAAAKSNKVKGVPLIFKAYELRNEKQENPQMSILSTKPGLNDDLDYRASERILTPEETETIISRNRSFAGDRRNVDKHQEMLINLVNHLFKVPLEEVKAQIQRWITNSKEVNEVDFVSLATFLSMLPERKRIEDLHVLLKTMHRCMTKTGNCIWHRTYRKTVRHVQHYMQVEYNSNLMVPPIRCDLLQCNSDVL